MSGTTYDTFSPPISPSSPIPLTEQPKLITAAMGDGYTVSAEDGINSSPINATLSWNMLTANQYNSILSFVRAHIGKIFLYTLPSETIPRKWVALSWHPNQYASWYDIQVLLQERFDTNPT